MRKPRLLPNLISFLNLFLGFWAILLVGRGQYLTACWMVVIAAIVDGLDGAMARLMRAPSRFGAELDSLADIVSFGVAPSLLVYYAVFRPFGTLGMLLAFIPLAAGVLRLARFNTTVSKAKPRRLGYTGMPIPCSALILTGYMLYADAVRAGPGEIRVWFSLAVAVSLLMVSPIPYRKFPVLRINGARHPLLPIAILIAGSAVVIWNPALTIFPFVMIYLVIGPVEWVFYHLHKVRSARQENGISGELLAWRKSRRLSRIRRRPS